jgi:MFS family permease
MALPRALSALRHRDFRLYWVGQAISLVGTWMQVMAQGWVVTDLSSDAIVLGLLNAAGSLPMLLLSLKGGELADRMEKRRILIATQIAMMLLAFGFAGLVYSGRLALWHVFAMSVLLGIAAAFDLPAAQSMPPELVEPEEIPNAVALMQSIFHGARLVGPALAGILIARFGRGSAFIANGASYIAVIFTLTAIAPRPARARRPGAGGPGAGGGRSMIGEGFAYVRSEPAVRALIALTALITGLIFPFLAVLMVYYVRYALGTDDAQVLGLMMSASGLGSLIGAAAIFSGSARSRRGWLVGGILGVCVGLVGLSVARAIALVLPFAAVLAFSVSSLMGRVSQMVQERVPGELRGRVMGIYSLSFSGIMPFAAMLWSWLVDRMGRGQGYTRVMQISAALFLVAALGVVWQAWGALAFEARAAPAGPPARS